MNLNQIEQAARAAGSDKWYVYPNSTGTGKLHDTHVWGGDGDAVARCFGNIGHMPEAIEGTDVSAFVATANPAAILEMCALIRKQEAEIAAMAQLHVVSAAAEGAKEQRPFMYAIKEPCGSAYIEEFCVAGNEEDLHSTLNGLNDSPDTGYTIVPVYLAAPQQHAQAAQPYADNGQQHEDPTGPNHPGQHDGHTCEAMGQMLADFGSQRTTPEAVVARMNGQAVLSDEQSDAIIASHQPAAAPSGHAEVDKMLETNQLDELGEEVARLQKALCFWLPSVTEREDEVALRILDDAFLLVGIDGNLPDDFKSAQELGWISITAPAAAPAIQQEGAALDERAACAGLNCGATDGVSHSAECQAEHDATIGVFDSDEEPEARYAGYKGHTLRQGATDAEKHAYAFGKAAALAPSPAQPASSYATTTALLNPLVFHPLDEKISTKDTFINVTVPNRPAQPKPPADAAPVRASEGWPTGYAVNRVIGHGWYIDPPQGGRWVAHEGTPAADFIAALATPAAVQQGSERDAARWRAFVGSARIKPQGSAGLENAQADNYAHMGLEIWTTFPRDCSAELLDSVDRDTELGRKWLTAYADVAVAAMAAQQDKPPTPPAAADRAAIHRKVLENGLDGPDVVGPTVCTVPPAGWHCTRAPGHDGPCAAWPVDAADSLETSELDALPYDGKDRT